MTDSKPRGADGQVREQWRPVVGYEDYYEVSDQGRVRGLDRHIPHAGSGTQFVRGRMMVPQPSKNGGWHVGLSDGGICRIHSIGRLVLEAFVAPPPTSTANASHINGDMDDNRVQNLAWRERQAVVDAVVARGNTPRGEDSAVAVLTEAAVADIRKMYLTGAWKMEDLAQHFGCSRGEVSYVINGDTWAHSMDAETRLENHLKEQGVPRRGTLLRSIYEYAKQHPGCTRYTMAQHFGHHPGDLKVLWERGLLRRWLAPETMDRNGGVFTVDTYHYEAVPLLPLGWQRCSSDPCVALGDGVSVRLSNGGEVEVYGPVCSSVLPQVVAALAPQS